MGRFSSKSRVSFSFRVVRSSNVARSSLYFSDSGMNTCTGTSFSIVMFLVCHENINILCGIVE